MKYKIFFIFLVITGLFLFAAEKPRIIVLTDISNEPDDEESMVRFLVYSNEYDVEGLIATASVWLKEKTREDLIRRQKALPIPMIINIISAGFTIKRQVIITEIFLFQRFRGVKPVLLFRRQNLMRQYMLSCNSEMKVHQIYSVTAGG
jgi:hypothetical protein